jgi:hypothetical protein
MRQILIIGAGRSASLIQYLLRKSDVENSSGIWFVFGISREKKSGHLMHNVALDILIMNKELRISKADIVISMCQLICILRWQEIVLCIKV